MYICTEWTQFVLILYCRIHVFFFVFFLSQCASHINMEVAIIQFDHYAKITALSRSDPGGLVLSEACPSNQSEM